MPNTINEIRNEKDYFDLACKRIPGGVNSPVRSFKSVGGTPICVKEAKGSRLCTIEGVELVDFCLSWGPLILGHADPDVVAAVREAAGSGLSFGCNHPGELELAELVCEMVPCADKLRLVSSGTEAVMSALRLARGVTGRERIVKFDGCYHGHSDALLVGAGSGLLTGGLSSSAGVPQSMVEGVHVLPYNDIDSVRRLFEAVGNEVAALIVEPAAGNMGLVQPEEGFLQELRTLTSRYGALLVFDEVITGFRFGPTSYGAIAGVEPDLTTLGKILGGGMPIGGIAGTAEVMERFAPVGDVYQAGTLSGNPVACAAGIATLKRLKRDAESLYPQLGVQAEMIQRELESAARESSVDLSVARLGGVFTPFMRTGLPRNLSEVKECDLKRHARFFHGLLKRGYYISPSQFELGFVSVAHSEADIEGFITAAKEVILELR